MIYSKLLELDLEHLPLFDQKVTLFISYQFL